MNVKKGFHTSEFWISLFASILAVVVVTGHITPEAQSELVEMTTRIVEGVFAVITGVTSIVTYVRSRVLVKKAHVEYRIEVERRRN